MNITLKFLAEINACGESIRAFRKQFGNDGAPTAREVFEALAAQDKRDWAIWLAVSAKGFLAAVGNATAGDWRAAVEGRVEVDAGFVLASDSATVRAYGSATVRAYGSATVEAYGSATVEAYGSATVEAYDRATVRAYGSATVRAYGSATVRAYGSATVEASDSATVRAYGEVNVSLFAHYSLQVNLTLNEKAACIDRRSGSPMLLVADEEAAR